MGLPGNLVTGRSAAEGVAALRGDGSLLPIRGSQHEPNFVRPPSEVLRLRLPWPPSVNHYWRIVTISGHGSIALTKHGRQYRAAVQAVAIPAMRSRDEFSGRLAVRITATFPDNRNRDLDNVLKAVLDALAHSGVYRDDSQIKLLIVEQEEIAAPGWLDVTIGHKPSVARQGELFSTNF